MKVGRNQPCPCGSGKKYKRCCLLAAEQQQPAPGPFDLDEGLRALVRANTSALNESMGRTVRAAFTRARQTSEWSSAKYDSDRIVQAIGSLKAIATEIVQSQSHSIHYCFQLFRRLVPILVRTLGFAWLGDHLSVSDKAHLRSGELVGDLIMLTSQLVILSAGAPHQHDLPPEWQVTPAGTGIDYSRLSLSELQVGANLVALALLWYDCKNKYRYANKEFSVFAKDGSALNLADEDTESIIIYEARRDKYDTIAGSAGFWYDPEQTSPIGPDHCGWFGASSIKQFDKQEPLKFEIGTQAFSVDFFWLPLSDNKFRHNNWEQSAEGALGKLMPYDRLLDRAAVWYETVLGTTSAAINSYLYSLYQLLRSQVGFEKLEFPEAGRIVYASADESPEMTAQIAARWREISKLVLVRASERAWIESLVRISHELSVADRSIHALSPKEVEGLTKLFTIIPGQSGDDVLPKLFVRLSGQALVLDLLLANDFLRHLIFLPSQAYQRDLGRHASLRDPVGRRLEEEAVGYFSRIFGLNRTNMIVSKDMGEREIDIAFVVNGRLIVIDCKAKMKDWDYMEGHHRKIRNRLSEFRIELKEKIPERIEIIRSGRCKNAIEPSSFSAAAGLVCTSSVEYLPKDESTFWHHDLPLVGPPDELVDSITGFARYS